MLYINIEASFEIVDAAAATFFQEAAPPSLNFYRIEETTASTVYVLHTYQTGIFGKVRIRKLYHGVTEIHFAIPPLYKDKDVSALELDMIPLFPWYERNEIISEAIVLKDGDKDEKLLNLKGILNIISKGFIEFLSNQLDEAIKIVGNELLVHDRWSKDDINNFQEGVEKKENKRGGRPGLTRDVILYRIEKAQTGEQMKKNDPSLTWKEIAKEIGWIHGYGKPGVKLLEDARQRLKRLQDDDPDGILTELERRK